MANESLEKAFDNIRTVLKNRKVCDSCTSSLMEEIMPIVLKFGIDQYAEGQQFVLDEIKKGLNDGK